MGFLVRMGVGEIGVASFSMCLAGAFPWDQMGLESLRRDDE